jgi:hypothetical protein
VEGGGSVKERLVEAILAAAVLGILGAAVQTYLEVKMLRHDVQRIEEILDNLVDNSKP